MQLNLFQPLTIDTAIADFTKTSDRLKKLVGKHQELSTKHAQIAEDHNVKSLEHKEQSARAYRISTNIEKIINA